MPRKSPHGRMDPKKTYSRQVSHPSESFLHEQRVLSHPDCDCVRGLVIYNQTPHDLGKSPREEEAILSYKKDRPWVRL